jgi:cation diffusion facilitator CzcD-associated flavoprotein CzcO
MPAESTHHRVAIIGTGFGGLCAAIKLKQAGVSDFILLERADDIGGTWRDNTYPGCCCDIRSDLYSFSFEQNPDWSRQYPPQAEIRDYLQAVCDKHGIRSHIRFGSEVTEMRFDQTRLCWSLTTVGANGYTADIVINATGPLSMPAFPEIEGLGSFEGTSFHSARWRHDCDLRGKKVAVIGTGASAIQFMPKIAPLAESVTVFQRSAPWVVPREDSAVTASRKTVYRSLPFVQRLKRWTIYLRQELLALSFLHEGETRLARRITEGCKEFIAATISDPEMRAAVTPDYVPGCKRLLISDDWYPALNRENVQLVTSGIKEIRPRSVIASDDTEHEVDTIIFGTGFAATKFLAPMKVFGLRDIELSQTWQQGAATHLGIAVSGFPNFFMLVGPNTGLGHNSIILMIEAQMKYIMGAVAYLEEHADSCLDLKLRVQEESYADVQDRMKTTVWASGCNSWYLSDDGRNDTLWPGYTFAYWRKTRRFDPAAFELLNNAVRS